MNDEIRIYVIDLAAYKNGKSHGVWINATDEPESIHYQINEMLEESPEEVAKEYTIYDYEGFDRYPLDADENIETIHEIACFIEEHPRLGGYFLRYFADIDEAKTAITQNYIGCYQSMADFGRVIMGNIKEVPEYFYDRIAQDMVLKGDVFIIEPKKKEFHVFYH